MAKTWDCPSCGKPFSSKIATQQHITDKHGGGHEPRRRKMPTRRAEDREMSLADISIEAALKRSMGEPLDALEESLLND